VSAGKDGFADELLRVQESNVGLTLNEDLLGPVGQIQMAL
jgi:hypothetical protein